MYYYFRLYRHGQPNWKYTILKIQDFSALKILREINFGHFYAPTTAILSIWVAMKFEFLGIFDIFEYEILPKSKFKDYKIVKF